MEREAGDGRGALTVVEKEAGCLQVPPSHVWSFSLLSPSSHPTGPHEPLSHATSFHIFYPGTAQPPLPQPHNSNDSLCSLSHPAKYMEFDLNGNGDIGEKRVVWVSVWT